MSPNSVDETPRSRKGQHRELKSQLAPELGCQLPDWLCSGPAWARCAPAAGDSSTAMSPNTWPLPSQCPQERLLWRPSSRSPSCLKPFLDQALCPPPPPACPEPCQPLWYACPRPLQGCARQEREAFPTSQEQSPRLLPELLQTTPPASPQHTSVLEPKNVSLKNSCEFISTLINNPSHHLKCCPLLDPRPLPGPMGGGERPGSGFGGVDYAPHSRVNFVQPPPFSEPWFLHL